MSASSTASPSSDDLSSESSSKMSDEPVLPEEPEGRKRRTVVTQQLVSTLITLVNPEKPDLKKIAASLHISLSTVNRILRKIRKGEFINDNRVVMPAKMRVRKRVFNSRTVEIVLKVMTSDPTMTVARA